MIIRLVKVAMVASCALFALLVTFNNLVDYGSNYEFVRHALSMDTTFPGNALTGRAITSPALWTLGYWLIIAAEAVTGVVLAFGSLRLALAVRGPAVLFNAPNRSSCLGSGWVSCSGSPVSRWSAANGSRCGSRRNGSNGSVSSAFRFYVTLLLVLIFVMQPDSD